MISKLLSGLLIIVITTCNSACKKDETNIPVPDSLSDIDGNNYNIITIGTQVWMAENLKTTSYNDGTAIPYVTEGSIWSALHTPAYCYYNNDPTYFINDYGALYNWYAIKSDKLCPTGWHVPTDTEWTIMTDFLGGEIEAGAKLKEDGINHWHSPNSGATNESGFSALPGGYRHPNSSFYLLGFTGNWWSSTDYFSLYAWFRNTLNNYSIVYRDYYSKGYGFSVRCLWDG